MKIRVNAARRLSYFAGASASVLSLLVAGAMVSVAIPRSAQAADECGVQAVDGDIVNCAAGTYATGISYTGDTVWVVLDDTVVVSDGGVSVTGTAWSVLYPQVNTFNAGDPHITNTTGAGITMTGGSVYLDLYDGDFGDATGSVTGLSGVVASGDGSIVLSLGPAVVTATDPAGYSVHAAATGSAGINLDGGMLNGDVLLTTVDGAVSTYLFNPIAGDLTAHATGTGGVSLIAFGGVTGSLTSSTAGGSVNVTAGNIGGDLAADAGGGGSATVTTGDVTGGATVAAALGYVSFSSGAVGDGIVGTGMGVSISAGGAVTGGIVATGGAWGASVSASSTVSGGVTATATGGGAVSITAGDVTGSGPGAPIVATSDTGDVSVTLNGAVTGGGDLAEISTGGSVTLSLNGGSVSQSDFDVTVGGALTINNGGALQGAINFAGATSGRFYNFAGAWTADAITFTEGDDLFENNSTATFAGSRTYDFLGGADSFTNVYTGTVNIGTALTLNNLETFTNEGVLVIGSAAGASTLLLSGATTLTNSGTIVFGGTATASDGEINDKLIADGAAFTGSGSSRLLLDVDIGGGNQANCADGLYGDCLSLVGGSTAGATTILLNNTGAGVGGLNRIVIVDVEGGASAASHFTLDAASELDQGLFTYRLDYDTANQQHVLVGLPSRGVFEFGQIAASAQSAWYTSTGTWFERHADLRDGADDSRGGAWLRVGRSLSHREQILGFNAVGEDFEFDGEHEQDTLAFVGGADLIHARGDDGKLVVGVTLGSIDSQVDFKVSEGQTTFEGKSYGAYASWIGEAFFIDGIVQLNKLDLEHTGAWNPGGWGMGTVDSAGAQIEMGMRWQVNDSEAYVEPLASVSYVRTQFDVLDFGGNTLEIDDAQSTRASLGVRIGGAADLGTVRLKLDGTGRVWQELEGSYSADLSSMGESFQLSDDLSGTFGDVGVGLSLYAGRISASLQAGVKFQENYLSSDTSLAIRYAW